ncbi:glycoside hydrolase family 9 protein [Cytophaga aurantiaca]|uniref:glycoside hydrolase family 9 protein n=1 Tax=Cytophaga aurantiaca TaxID=29530 RepID=UPI0014615D62|nr:glycoside hydrolase family 9 protein [Cytophaga aurantiaca]
MNTCNAQAISKYIVVDQFGYRPVAQKVAVLRDPVMGVDAAESFTPGTSYALVNTSTNAQVFTGTPTIWQNGKTDSLAGDKVWWFDFSSYTTPGSYYVLDVQKNIRSYAFDIKDDVYNQVLKQAVRFFFYQRSGFAKQLPYAEAGWVDGASHLKPLQDKNCRYYLTPNDASSEKDLHGGWYDAGDFNKYTSWTGGYIIALLKAYEDSPTAWTDDFNIPESNNTIPDILDEVKWGMDYLLRLQNSNGSVISLVGVESASPPSSATQASKYANPTTAATLKAAAAYAFGAKLFRKIGLPCYADSLQNAAVKAWNWADANPSVTWDNSGTGVGAGNPETNDYGRLIYKLEAAEHLYAITNDAKYRTFFDNNYSQGHLVQWYYAFPYEHDEQEVLLYYTTIPNATASVVSTIKDRYLTAINGANNFGAFDSKKSSYLAYLESYVWGSSNINSLQGLMFFESVKYNVNPSRDVDAMKAAENYVHYIHGLNPLNQCYLTNMNKYGAEKSATQLFHSWFMDGSAKWDQVGVSTYGPAPGFLVGGANGSYNVDGCCANNSCGSTSNNALCNNAASKAAIGQPPMKSFADINNGWPLNTWAITEPSCGYQVAYIRLLSKFVKANGTNLNSTISCSAFNFPIVSISAPVNNATFAESATVNLTAIASDPNGTVSKVEFYNGATKLGEDATSPYTFSWTNVAAGTYIITAVATDNAGNRTTSAAITIKVNAVPVSIITAASTTSFCAGGSVVLNASTGTAYTYQWKRDGNDIGSATSSSYTATQSGNYTVAVSANSQTVTSTATTVTVYALPTITQYAQINGAAWNQVSTATVCAGSTVVLGPQPSVATGWTWSGPNGYSASTREITLASVTTTQGGIYTATYTDGNTCKATSTFTLTVNAIPTAAITTTTSTTFCTGGSVVLTASTGSSYVWKNGSTTITGATAQSYTATTAGSYTVEVTNASSCKATSAATTVTVNALPTAAITTTTPTTFCTGSSVVLTASSGSSYVWKNGTTQVGTNQTYTATTAGTYTVEVTNAGNCKATSASTTVTVNALPTAAINTTTPTTFCAGGSVVLTAGAGSSYKWMNGTTQVGTAQIYTATTTGNYTVEVTNAGNCKATSASTTVTVNAAPTSTITASGSTSIPQGGSVVLTANTGSGFTYKWFKGSVQVGTAQTYTATDAGVYTVEVTNANNCSATSAGTNVNINSNQPSVITITSPVANTTVQGTITIAADVTDPDGTIVAVEFLDGNMVIGTSTTAPYSFDWNNPGQGTHVITVRVTDSNGGVTTSAPVTITAEAITTGVQSSNTLNANIYPNPSNGIVFIDSDTDLSGASCILVDVMGNEHQLLQTTNGLSAQVNVSNLSDGIYILIINKNNSVMRKKITVIR